MASAPHEVRMTPAEYLAVERRAATKSEFYDGVMYPMGESPRGMAGASLRHGQIARNLLAALHAQFGNGPCQVFMSDLRVALGDGGFVYPDLVVVCGEPQLLDGEFDTLLNPTAIIEVLSPTTEGWDRDGKFAHYRRLPTLRHYVLVGQADPAIERHDRQPDDSWLRTEMPWPDGALALPATGAAVPLRAIYARVFPASQD